MTKFPYWLDLKVIPPFFFCARIAQSGIDELKDNKDLFLKYLVDFNHFTHISEFDTHKTILKRLETAVQCKQERLLGYFNKYILEAREIAIVCASYFYLIEPMKPIDLVTWAINCKSFDLPDSIIEWYKDHTTSESSSNIDKKLHQRIAELEQQLAEKEAQLAEWQAKQDNSQQSKKTDAATLARLKKTFQEWKDNLPAMAKVYAQCIGEGEKERTEEEIKRMFAKNGDAISETQLAEFKKALGPKHVKTTPGASKTLIGE